MTSQREEVEALARAQWRGFEAALSGLIAQHPGRWAVWLDGLKHVADTEAEAFVWSDAHTPLHSGVVVARIEEQTLRLMSSAFAFAPAR